MIIAMSCGMAAVVDDVDFALVAGKRWYVSSHGNGHRYVACRGPNGRPQLLHRLITGATRRDQIVDHVNGDPLDNRRANLRICTQAENGRNRRGPNKNNSSGVRGVHFCKLTGRWRAVIDPAGKRVCLGRFDTLEEAADARFAGEIRYFGAFAGTNHAP